MTHEEKLKKIVNDPLLFIKTFMKVVDKNNRTVPFNPSDQQIDLLKTMEDSKYTIVLKSRQLGITTLSSAYSLWVATTTPDATCLLMAHSIDAANNIFSKLKSLHTNMADGIRPNLIANNKQELKFENGSRIIVSACGRKEHTRGTTLNFAHVSEAAFCGEAFQKQMLALEQALVSTGKLVVESTANGIGNFYQEMWSRAERQENLYKPVFYGWHTDKRMFSDEHKQFAERYVDLYGHLPTDEELDEKEISLQERGATPEMLAWRRLKIMNSSDEHFSTEFPSIPIEAFLSTGSNVFDPAQLTECLLAKTAPKHITSAPDNFPQALRPILNRGLTIWHLPKTGMRYYIGGDISEGVKQDFTALEVFDAEGMQVAEFKSNTVKPYVTVDILHNLALYYGKAMIIVEKASGGHTVLDRLKNDKHYINLFRQRAYDKFGKQTMDVGFTTSAKSKAQIIGDFVELFETKQMYINSEDLLKEMKLFSSDDTGKMGAKRGAHDDMVMATALAIHAMKSRRYYC